VIGRRAPGPGRVTGGRDRTEAGEDEGMSSAEQQIIEIIAESVRLNPSEVTRASGLRELGVASLDIVMIVFAIEEKFNIKIPYNANDQMAGIGGVPFTNVGEIVDGVLALVAAQHGPGAGRPLNDPVAA
jgi:acyl carrier protein